MTCWPLLHPYFGQGKQDKGSHLGGGHVTKEMLGEIDVWVAQMFGMLCVKDPWHIFGVCLCETSDLLYLLFVLDSLASKDR